MPEIVIPQRFAQRRDTAANWASANPVLWEGEIGFELIDPERQTIKWKIGDGVTPWNSLPYFSSGGGGTVDMRVDSGWIQYTNDEGATWNNIIAVADLQGPPGADGDDGADGLSAYQIAVIEGFVGTEAEWLASLQGAPGEDGEDGAPGGPTQVMTTSGNLTITYAAHNGKYLRHSNGTITLPEPVAAGFAVGDIVEFRCMAMTVSFAAGAGATLDYDSSRYAPAIFGLRDVVAAKVADATTWDLIGALADAP